MAGEHLRRADHPGDALHPADHLRHGAARHGHEDRQRRARHRGAASVRHRGSQPPTRRVAAPDF
eukprot:scaffold19039_cov72-Phaeocystis_antarctica.AAC.5